MAESCADFRLTYDLDATQVEEGPSNEVSTVDEAEVGARHHCGRKHVRNLDSWKRKHVKKKGLRRNAPQLSIDDVTGKNAAKKTCIQHVSAEYLTSLR